MIQRAKNNEKMPVYGDGKNVRDWLYVDDHCSAIDLIVRYGLSAFDVKTQKLERTFVDKIFAICDYHISRKLTRQSRHIYDLYKILPLITLDESLL